MDEKQKDYVSPHYYQTNAGVELSDVVLAMNLGFLRGNAFKYLVRWRKKNFVRDLEKARWYLEKSHLEELYPARATKAQKMIFEIACEAFQFTDLEREVAESICFGSAHVAWIAVGKMIEGFVPDVAASQVLSRTD